MERIDRSVCHNSTMTKLTQKNTSFSCERRAAVDVLVLSVGSTYFLVKNLSGSSLSARCSWRSGVGSINRYISDAFGEEFFEEKKIEKN